MPAEDLPAYFAVDLARIMKAADGNGEQHPACAPGVESRPGSERSAAIPAGRLAG